MFALEDLYNTTKNTAQPAPVVSPVTSSATGNKLQTTDLISVFIRDFRVSYWAVEANQWLLAFTVFYSIWFGLDFIFYRIIFHDGEVENEERGLKSLSNLYRLWYGYFIFLAVWCVAIFGTGLLKTSFEWISLFVWLIVLFGVDLPMIPVLGGVFGGSDSVKGSVLSQIWSATFGILLHAGIGFLEGLGILQPPVKK
jgi:hypothetical protein